MMRMLLIFTICLGLGSCTVAKAAIAMNRSTSHFQEFGKDPRILFEAGAEANARIVSNHIDAAIQRVEQQQYKKFTKPVTIHVCNSVESFTDYCVVSRASGCVLNERLFLAPKAFEKDQPIITHELSHLHMEQQLGMAAWHNNAPSWFQEGLAVYVSDGEGANQVSIDDAWKSIKQGKRFYPETEGSLLFKKSASSYGLKPDMFYRQASMFVAFLENHNPAAFKNLLLSIASGTPFEQAFRANYLSEIELLWNRFTSSS